MVNCQNRTVLRQIWKQSSLRVRNYDIIKIHGENCPRHTMKNKMSVRGIVLFKRS
jgi:hypothetical protein